VHPSFLQEDSEINARATPRITFLFFILIIC